MNLGADSADLIVFYALIKTLMVIWPWLGHNYVEHWSILPFQCYGGTLQWRMSSGPQSSFPSDPACNLYFLAVFALCVIHKGTVALSSSPAWISPVILFPTSSFRSSCCETLKKNSVEIELLLETRRVHLFKGRAASTFVKLKIEKISYRLLARQLDNAHKHINSRKFFGKLWQTVINFTISKVWFHSVLKIFVAVEQSRNLSWQK